MENVIKAIGAVRSKYDLWERPLTFRDFHRICKGEGIPVSFLDVPTAFCVWIDAKPAIFLSSRLRGRKRRHAAFHELGHALMHGDRAQLVMNLGKDLTVDQLQAEREADEFAAKALNSL